MVFVGAILDGGKFRKDEKSMNLAVLLSELLENFYQDCCREISNFAQPNSE